MLTFDQLSKEVGFDDAVVIYYHKLPESFLEKLTFKQWFGVCKAAALGSDIEMIAITRIFGLEETTFEQKLEVYMASLLSVDSLKDIVLGKFSESKGTFKQWLAVYRVSLLDSDLRAVALTKLQEALPE